MTKQDPQLQGRMLIYLAVLATILVYWSGLKGPFLLDDLPNLRPLQRWLEGRATIAEVIQGNRSGMLGRPLSMASLWFSAATGGMHPFPFKLGNLLIHIACGLLGWQLLTRLVQEDKFFAAKASLVAAVLAGLWMLHPINVSTVLYAIQRMAQLSAFFALAAVWIYVLARQQLAAHDTRPATIKLFLIFPLLLLAGLFSKENAALIPVLCLVVELAYFQNKTRSGNVLPAFYGLFLLLPALLVCALLATQLDVLLNYQRRDFTLVERLLSQPRALADYIGLFIWPRTGQMGVFVDDFAHSTGLFSPPSTFLAIIAIAVISVLAVALRRQAPSIFAGWFFFLAAHSMESGFLPLELYFLHRNYLPSFGLLLAAAGTMGWLAQKARATESSRLTWAPYALIGAVAIGLASTTWQYVQVWRSMDSIVADALEHRPDSLRATLEQLTQATNKQDWELASSITARLAASTDPRRQFLGHVNTVTIDCLAKGDGHRINLIEAEHVGLQMVTLVELQAYTPLSLALGHGRCGNRITESVVADSIVRLLDGLTNQPNESQAKWLLRTTAADLYQRAERWEDAQRQAELAWIPDVSDSAIAGMLVRIHIHNGNKVDAQRVLNQARARVSKYEIVAAQAIRMDQQRIDAMPD